MLPSLVWVLLVSLLHENSDLTTHQNTLRQCDWDEFQNILSQITDLWIKSGGGGHTPEPGPVEERYAKSAELRAHALDILKDFPELVRDFDRFVAACHAATAAVRRSGPKK